VKKPKWLLDGSDPDYRFSLANERTFLAWIRTSLAFVAAGVLLKQFAITIKPHWLVLSLALGLAALSALASVLSYLRWKNNEIAMRHSGSLPFSASLPIVSVSIFILSVALGLAFVLQ